MNGKQADETLAVVIVTYNRVGLLEQCLDKLAEQTYPAHTVIVVDNASTDNTAEFLRNYKQLPLTIHNSEENTGGAGGFYQGVKLGYELGYDWLYIVDDDVFPDSRCIENLMSVREKAMISVREDNEGNLVERSALKYDLTNPFCLNPKRISVEQKYKSRSDMPETLVVENIPFEGLMIYKEVINRVGFPEPSYFISSDDVDYSLRIRKAGYEIYAVRDALLRRQLPYDQEKALSSWKGYYMYRNFFHIHYKFGENWMVRKKPYWVAAVLIIKFCSLLDFKQAKSVVKAVCDFKELSLSLEY